MSDQWPCPRGHRSHSFLVPRRKKQRLRKEEGNCVKRESKDKKLNKIHCRLLGLFGAYFGSLHYICSLFTELLWIRRTVVHFGIVKALLVEIPVRIFYILYDLCIYWFNIKFKFILMFLDSNIKGNTVMDRFQLMN